MGTLRFDDAPDVDLLAYTFTFGNGFSATVSIEDGLERRQTGFIPGGPNALAFSYAGQRVPDVVGNIKYTGTWGTAQLSGAIHQVRSNNLYTINGFSDYADTEYGFAVAFAGSVNLPMLGAGDALWVAATYADGAPGYLNGGTVGGSNGTIISPTTEFGSSNILLVDGYINPLSGDLKKSTSWAVAGGLRHYWTPQLRSNFFGSYLRANYGAGAQALTVAGTTVGLVDFNEYRVGANIFWQPVSGLDLGVEVIYAKVDPRGRVATPFGTVGSSDAIEGRVRVQRDF
jgi:hypothetical protein